MDNQEVNYLVGSEGKVEKFPDATYVGELDQAEYQALKQKHGRIDMLVVPVGNELKEFAVAYLKKIERTLMSAYLSSNDPIAKKEMLLSSIFIAGDRRVIDDDDVFYSACLKVDEMIAFPYGVFVKN